MVTILSESEIESALETINDPPLDPGRLEFSIQEPSGLDKALQRTHGELINNLPKLTELDITIERENEKLIPLGTSVRKTEEPLHTGFKINYAFSWINVLLGLKLPLRIVRLYAHK